MTTFTTNSAPFHAADRTAPRISRLFGRIREILAERAARRASYKALRLLTDRELDDIGLTRRDVDAMH